MISSLLSEISKKKKKNWKKSLSKRSPSYDTMNYKTKIISQTDSALCDQWGWAGQTDFDGHPRVTAMVIQVQAAMFPLSEDWRSRWLAVETPHQVLRGQTMLDAALNASLKLDTIKWSALPPFFSPVARKLFFTREARNSHWTGHWTLIGSSS